ncbi:MAG: hypothetical protein LBD88_02890 [Candidatus Peribacteria bacterium]|nr:hypothetical protein [Candidatus Peribacteria bacterium]
MTSPHIYSLYQTNFFLSFIISESKSKNTLEIHITVKSDNIIQIASINQNPFIIFTQKIKSIIAVISHVKFESHIADQDSLNQESVASKTLSPSFSFSLILSKIKIFASIAIHIESITQAIEAIVITTQKVLTTANIKIA